jgi:hypothetical protein
MTLELKKFSMQNITFKADENKGPVIVLIGRRDTGKSYLVRDLLFYHQDIPIGTVISGTEAGNGFYGSHVPKLFIHEEYNTAIVENILKRQKTVLKQVKREVEQYKRSTIDPRAFVILDDCLFDATWTNLDKGQDHENALHEWEALEDNARYHHAVSTRYST